ncbi:MAG TPA: PTS sugar transporter subunit IIA [Polyangia bacterium]|nr:PTS sugar transporter subunit IIA [Polyangia bacterium]
MKVLDFLRPNAIVADLAATTKAAALAELSTRMASLEPSLDAEELRRVLEERELLASTAIGDGIAIPHGKLDAIGHLAGVLGRSRAGLDFDSIDGRPTHLLFMLVAPVSSTGVHLKALARLSRLFRDPEFRARLLAAPTGEAMYQVISDEDAKY